MWKYIIFIVWKFQQCKDINFPHIFNFNTIPIKIPLSFMASIDKIDLKFI